ncbi:MAG: thiamine ABC transporter substrate-binding protein [Ilumatobacter coccineus]|uniref:Thiamine ABC transporter substrate-binding protein n=1 Tax=Ilumatobacter coccineus TaxID=467094 RepID=A0A2G6KIH3_9ACTN|nr:MAG: thiamine ABC transporter substrate-binding protein [Ilumatobacter coccineus]
MTTRSRLVPTILTVGTLILAACGGDATESGPTTAPDDDTAKTSTETSAPAEEVPPSDEGTVPAPQSDVAGQTVTLVAYDSFPVDEGEGDERNPIWVALDEFTAETGIEVELLTSGDTGTMLSKATLTAGNPEGDVLWGVDNTFLSRALDAGVFEPYVADGVDALPDALTALVPNGEATPVDFGDVCVNYDIAKMAELGLEPPASLADLARAEYASQLVVENPATSSPGLAFVLATIAEFGADGWQDFWSQLTKHGVAVADGWTQAYYEQFSWAGGDRAMVVSYGSSPPFEVLYAAEPMDAAPTGVVEATCFRQVEFAGVLAGTEHPEAAQALVDFLISERFQREIALNLFVFPVNPQVELGAEFIDYAVIPTSPLTLDPAEIEANRSKWIDEWTGIVTG